MFNCYFLYLCYDLSQLWDFDFVSTIAWECFILSWLLVVYGYFLCDVWDEQCEGCSKALQWHSTIQIQSLIQDQYFVHEVCTRSTGLQYEEENDGYEDLFPHALLLENSDSREKMNAQYVPS